MYYSECMHLASQATLIILKCQDEYLFIQRSSHLNTFPGFTTFPGGMIESEEAQLNFVDTYFKDPEIQKAFQAGIRELDEELGVQIKAQDIEMKPPIYLGYSFSPPVIKSKYHLHYFLIEVSKKPKLKINPQEIARAFWLDCNEFNTEYESGKHLCVPTTLKILDALSNKEFKEQDFSIDIKDTKGLYSMLSGIWHLPVKSRALAPAEYTMLYLIGNEKEMLCVDPGPKDDHAYEIMLERLQALPIKAIFISHAHIDHYQSVDRLAKALAVPVLLTQESLDRIKAFKGESYFLGVNLQFIKAGDTVTHWQGQAVKTLDISGHANNQLGLVPESQTWLFISDCVDEKSSVVVEDMPTYMKTLQLLMSYQPVCWLTSHSGLVSKASLIARNYKHRVKRIQQIHALHQSGQSVQDILGSLYQNLDPSLIPFAQLNIEGYLQVDAKSLNHFFED